MQEEAFCCIDTRNISIYWAQQASVLRVLGKWANVRNIFPGVFDQLRICDAETVVLK